MIHAGIIILIVALMAGVAAVTISTVSYRQSRSKHLIAHLHFVVSVNLIILVNVAVLYFYQNLSSQVSAAAVLFVDDLYQITMPALQVITVFNLYRLSSVLLGIDKPRFRSKYLVPAVVAITLIQIMFTVWRPAISTFSALYMVYRGVEIGTVLSAYIIIFLMLIRAGKLRAPARKRSIRVYSAMFALILTLALLLSAMNWLNWVSTQVLTAIIAALVLASNLVPVLYYQRFLVPHFSPGEMKDRPLLTSAELKERFDISNREYEVLILVCEGKTNQEIADRLFISLQTVKDHVSRIYRKMGVRNRVQLISLIGDRENYSAPEDRE